MKQKLTFLFIKLILLRIIEYEKYLINTFEFHFH